MRIKKDSGVSDHGGLTGLVDDDHSIYLLEDGSEAMAGPLELVKGSKITDSADGIVEITNGAEDQGIRLDTSVNSALTLTDEAGGNLTLVTNGLDAFAIEGKNSGILYVRSSGRSDTTATGGLVLQSGSQTNVNDHDSGIVYLRSGATTTDGDTGNVEIYTGAAGAGAADAGDIVMSTHGTIVGFQVKGADGFCYMGTVAQGVKFDTSADNVLSLTTEAPGNLTLKLNSIELGGKADFSESQCTLEATYAYFQNNQNSGEVQVTTKGASISGTSGRILLYTGSNSNSGDYDTGEVKIYTGATTTDGDSGNVSIYSGAAGAGAADAGDIFLAVNGTPAAATTALTISGATRQVQIEHQELSYAGRASLGCVSKTFNHDDMTDDGGNSVGWIDFDDAIPDGAVVQRTILHTLTGFTNDTSAVITVGDGTTADRYNTGTPNVFVTNVSGVDMGAVSGTEWHDDAKTPRVTITTDSDFTSVNAGTCTVAIYYYGA